MEQGQEKRGSGLGVGLPGMWWRIQRTLEGKVVSMGWAVSLPHLRGWGLLEKWELVSPFSWLPEGVSTGDLPMSEPRVCFHRVPAPSSRPESSLEQVSEPLPQVGRRNTGISTETVTV